MEIKIRPDPRGNVLLYITYSQRLTKKHFVCMLWIELINKCRSYLLKIYRNKYILLCQIIILIFCQYFLENMNYFSMVFKEHAKGASGSTFQKKYVIPQAI